MRTDDLESAFAIRKALVTESSTVSVECPRLNPDWLASSRLCFDRNEDNWLKTTCSSVFAMNERRETGLYLYVREMLNVVFLSSNYY